MTLQSDQMTQYVDVETERLINEALEIAEDIKMSIDKDAELINMDWILKDTTNFIDKFQAMSDAVLGHIPGEIKPVDDKMMCFRVLTLIVYASKIYLAVKDSELRTFIEANVCNTYEIMNVNWTILEHLSMNSKTRKWIIRFGVWLGLTIILFSINNCIHMMKR